MATKSDIQENRRALITTIRETDLEIIDLKAELKDVEKDLTEHVGGFTESKEVKRLTEELDAAKQKQAAVLSQDGDFHEMMELKSNLNRRISDAKEVLSSHVVAWKTLTGEDQVEYDDVMGKEVIVTGRLGKLQRYQTNIFTDPETRAKMDPLKGFQKLADKHDVTVSIGSGDEEVVVASPKRGRGRPKKTA